MVGFVFGWVWTMFVQCKDECDRWFRSLSCYTAHLGKECEKMKRCLKCTRVQRRTSWKVDKETGVESHAHCGERYCRTCTKWVDAEDHEFCFIQPFKAKFEAEWVKACPNNGQRILLYLPGGAYVIPMPNAHSSMVSR